jgi:hypothetical protein
LRRSIRIRTWNRDGWCVAVRFKLVGGEWREHDDTDNSTTQRPFERPTKAENSTSEWFAWHSNGGSGGYGDPLRYHHMFFGIAPVGTARLVVTDETGRERDLAITPWCGAYVASVEGEFSRLTGYGENGELLGSVVCSDGPTPEPDLVLRLDSNGRGPRRTRERRSPAVAGPLTYASDRTRTGDLRRDRPAF